jgi:hypothetical protein
MAHFVGWELWYFNYWLTHMFYFAAGLIILFAISYNKWNEYQTKIKILKRLKHYTGNPIPIISKERLWLLNR